MLVICCVCCFFPPGVGGSPAESDKIILSECKNKKTQTPTPLEGRVTEMAQGCILPKNLNLLYILYLILCGKLSVSCSFCTHLVVLVGFYANLLIHRLSCQSYLSDPIKKKKLICSLVLQNQRKKKRCIKNPTSIIFIFS